MENQQNQKKNRDINFRKLFRKIPGLYLIITADDYEIVAVNDAYLEAIRRKRSDLVGQRFFKDIITDPKGEQIEGFRKLRRSFERVKRDRSTDTMPITHFPLTFSESESNDGFLEERWWSPVNSPIVNADGEVELIVHRVEDVTPVVKYYKKENIDILKNLKASNTHLAADILLRGQDLHEAKEEAYKHLQKSEKKYRAIFENIDEGFCILEKIEDQGEQTDFRILEANPGFETHSGVKDPVGKTVLEVIPELEESIFKVLNRVAETGKPLRFEDYILSMDLWVSAFIFRFDAPGPVRLGVLFNDITERKKVEEALRKSKDKYQTLFKSIDAGFFIMEVLFDENGQANDLRFLETNPSFETQSGIKEAEGKNVNQIIPELEDTWFEIYGDVVLNREPIRFVQGAEALERIFDVYAFPIGQPEEHKIAVLFSDITERKQTEKELKESKKRLSTALEIDTVGIIFWGSDFTITEANDAFLRMSGFSYEQTIGKTWQELTPNEFYDASKKAIADIKATGHTEPYEKQYYRKDGSRWWGLFAPRQISDKETVEYVLDITDRKQREQRDQFLLELNDTLRSFSDSNQIRNKAIELLQEQLNTNRVLYIESTSDGDQFVVKNDFTEGVPSIEGEINLSDFGSLLVDTLRAGETYIERDALKDPRLKKTERDNFQDIDVLSKVAVPLVKNGELVVVLAVEKAEPYDWSDHEVALVEETAERTWAYVERLRAEEKLVALKNNLEERVKERTAALQSYQHQLQSLASRLNKAEQKAQNRLATELHDNLGQLLSLSKMKIQDVKKNIPADDVTEEINNLSDLIDSSLTYTRELTSDLKPPPSLSEEDFSEILDWIIKKMNKHGLQVSVEDDGKPKPLDEEVRTTLHQSLKELLFNVVKHSGVKEAHVSVSRNNGMMKVTVEDHGEGFNMEGEEPVPTEEGGFGLFNIRERMSFQGGKFELSSEPGSGTKATLYAPLKEKKTPTPTGKDELEPTLVEETSEPAELQQEIKVLIADDHDMVRRGLRNLIETQDDMTITAEADNGKEALDLAHKTHPDVIVMDVNMPVMDGIEATRKITSSLPNVHVIGLSFYNQDEVARNMRSAGASAYLSKDEAFEALCATIRSEATILKEE